MMDISLKLSQKKFKIGDVDGPSLEGLSNVRFEENKSDIGLMRTIKFLFHTKNGNARDGLTSKSEEFNSALSKGNLNIGISGDYDPSKPHEYAISMHFNEEGYRLLVL